MANDKGRPLGRDDGESNDGHRGVERTIAAHDIVQGFHETAGIGPKKLVAANPAIPVFGNPMRKNKR